MSGSFVAKVVILGEGAVGKTSLRKRYIGKGFTNSHLMTLGSDFANADIRVGEGKILKAQIWDLAGQPHFKAIRQRFLLKAKGAIVVFDLTRPETFYNLPGWLNELWTSNKTFRIPLIIVGNKIDLKKSKDLKLDTIQNFIAQLQSRKELEGVSIQYIETSAKTGENVETAFKELGKIIVELLENKEKQ